MAYEELCMYCFEDLQGQAICPHCGRDSRAAVPQIQMLPGTLVYHDRFLVGRALGQDATGIVYSAYDTKRETKLKLREYLPRDCAERLNDGSVVPMAGLEDQFEKGMRKLRASVEGVEDPRKRHFFFEENGTAYIAQRKSSPETGDRYAGREDDGDQSDAKRLGLIIGGAVAVVIIAVVVIVSLVNGALKSADDVIQNPTLAPSASNALWAPAETPTPTPYVSPTFAALVDPDQSWMDYTYSGDVNKDFDSQLGTSSTATPKPTIRPQTTQNPTVNNKSDAAEITSLQKRLAQLGWLSSNKVTGKYDSATKQAVKDFQNYVNTAIKPNPKLTVDGIAGPITQQWLYGTDTVKPTATAQPTPAVTPDPNQSLTVDKNSSKNDVKAVQRKLIVLGLMKSGSDDGVYGSTTTAAVKKFQQRVNQLQGYNALSVTGTVDPTTMAYLNYYVEWWENLQKATATPDPVLPTTPTPEPVTPATPEPTDAPTPEPTDIPDKEESGTTVDANSPQESIAFVQEMLIGVGLLPEGSNDGVYGTSTSKAVLSFQQWVNAQLGFGTVPETGVADQLTLSYLETAYGEGMSVLPQPTNVPASTDAPTPVPTDAPTPEPTDIPDQEEGGFAVTPDSPKESIQYVQQMMIEAGLLSAGSDDGVYGSSTVSAMQRFQKYVNQVFGANTVPEDGMGDSVTLGYLEEFISRGMTLPADPTQVPQITDAPTPTDAPEQENGDVTPDSPKESIQNVQQLLIKAGLLSAGSADGVYGSGTSQAVLAFQQYVNDYFADSRVPEDGIADSVTLSYLEQFVSRGMTVPTATAEPTQAPAAQVELQIGGTQVVNGVHALTGDRITFQWKSSVPCEYYIYVTDASGNSFYTNEATDRTQGAFGASELEPGMVYTIQVGALPVNGDEVEMVWTSAQFGVTAASATEVPATEVLATEVPATEVPATEVPATEVPATEVPATEPPETPGVIESLRLTVNGASPSGIVQVTGDSMSFQWGATGELDHYIVVVQSNSGEQLVNWASTQETKGALKASQLTPGEVYTISVSAVPARGGESVRTEARFGVPAASATDAPASDVSAPVISIDGAAYTENGVQVLTGDTAIFTWASTGDVKGYMIYILNSADSRRNLDPTTKTSMTVSLSDLPADTYRIFVGAVPASAQSEADVRWSSLTFSIGSTD